MTALLISNQAPWGLMTNQTIASLYALNEQISRLQSAVTNAAASFGGTAGTEYEGTTTNFGVSADATPGVKGADYAYAVSVLSGNWATFWTASIGSIQALDNGVTS